MSNSIQFLSFSKKNDVVENVCFSSFSEPESLDSFEINIIDLNCSDIWYYNGTAGDSVNCKHDFENIQTMIRHSKTTRIIVFLPQDYRYHFNKVQTMRGSYDFKYSEQLKNKTSLLSSIIEKSILPHFTDHFPSIHYENTKTMVDGEMVSACFCFDSFNFTAITLSTGSQKITTIELGNKIFLSTLVFDSTKKVISFVRGLFAEKNLEQAPEWMGSISFGSDEEQHRVIEEKEAEIKQCQLQIAVAQEKLKKNDYYKSILHSTGDQLVEVVYDMLESMLECDLSEFVDVKNEDFLIKKESVTFIGEIKGIGSNVKSDNISQVDRHCASYSDELQDKGIHENLKEILIINPFRSKKLEDREPINDIQLRLAQRNECLIIKTEVLLRIFEAFLDGKISSQQIQECFASNSGELSICKALQSDM